MSEVTYLYSSNKVTRLTGPSHLPGVKRKACQAICLAAMLAGYEDDTIVVSFQENEKELLLWRVLIQVGTLGEDLDPLMANAHTLLRVSMISPPMGEKLPLCHDGNWPPIFKSMMDSAELRADKLETAFRFVTEGMRLQIFNDDSPYTTNPYEWADHYRRTVFIRKES